MSELAIISKLPITPIQFYRPKKNCHKNKSRYYTAIIMDYIYVISSEQTKVVKGWYSKWTLDDTALLLIESKAVLSVE